MLAHTGVALAVLVACLAAVDAFPCVHRLARPVIAVGTMSLTAYGFHVVGIRVLGIEELPGSPLHVLLSFIAAVTVFATLWSRFFRRGPLCWGRPPSAEHTAPPVSSCPLTRAIGAPRCCPALSLARTPALDGCFLAFFCRSPSR
jgi:uncharacterized membrane protein YeiB